MPYLFWCHNYLVPYVFQMPLVLHILLSVMSRTMSYVYNVSYVYSLVFRAFFMFGVLAVYAFSSLDIG